MAKENLPAIPQSTAAEVALQRIAKRRSFLKGIGIAGAALSAAAPRVLPDEMNRHAADTTASPAFNAANPIRMTDSFPSASEKKTTGDGIRYSPAARFNASRCVSCRRFTWLVKLASSPFCGSAQSAA
jgi:hypothetical protein